jgi:hypothetical protein
MNMSTARLAIGPGFFAKRLLSIATIKTGFGLGPS